MYHVLDVVPGVTIDVPILLRARQVDLNFPAWADWKGAKPSVNGT
jgi:hypothetical protein